ncbi:Restriction endonuclease [uncultured archaeon]|nr:Restriction endonuclease [uncultured archaeon]
MKKTVESWVQQGNTYFLAGKHDDALQCYYKALKKSGALQSVVKYVQKNKNDLSEDQGMLQEYLNTKYHIRLIHAAVPILLISIKNQIEEIETIKTYQQFKKLILSKHPTTPEQYVDVFLDHYEKPLFPEMELLSTLLLEQGFTYYICDVDRLCHDQSKARDLKRFEQSLQKSTTFSDIDTMTGYEFEDFLVTLLTKLGYRVEKKKKSHEQGLDFLLERPGEKIACQVKRYTKPVGNRAVQQAHAACVYYHCQRAIVMTNSTFTTPAKQLAERCNVELWDRTVLKEKFKTLM